MEPTNTKKHKINLKKKIVAQGLFESELKQILTDRISEEGFADVRVRNKGPKTEIIVLATRTQNVLGDNCRLYNELGSLIRQRFSLSEDHFELFVDRVPNRAFCSQSQSESIKFKLTEGINARRAAISVMNFVMRNGADGVEIAIAGKLRGQRAKTVKFKSGYMIKSGDAKQRFVDKAVRHVHLKQGVLGIQVSIQIPRDETGKQGPSESLPDVVRVREPEEILKIARVAAQSGLDAEMTDDKKKDNERNFSESSGERGGRGRGRGRGNFVRGGIGNRGWRGRGRGNFARGGMNNRGGRGRGRGQYDRVVLPSNEGPVRDVQRSGLIPRGQDD